MVPYKNARNLVYKMVILLVYYVIALDMHEVVCGNRAKETKGRSIGKIHNSLRHVISVNFTTFPRRNNVVATNMAQ